MTLVLVAWFSSAVTVAVTTAYCDWHSNGPRMSAGWFFALCVVGPVAIGLEILFNWQPWKTPWR